MSSVILNDEVLRAHQGYKLIRIAWIRQKQSAGRLSRKGEIGCKHGEYLGQEELSMRFMRLILVVAG